MLRTRWYLALLIMVSFAGCGPDTIFVRPGLDTPAQHVQNGHQLMKRGKLDDACREFNRAMELDSNYVNAYVGLGLALGQKGEIEAGMAAMAQAEQLASSQKDRDAVQDGFRKLNDMKTRSEGEANSP